MEVTVRTVQSRLLLRPSLAVNEIILGVLGRAQRLYPVRCCSLVFMSNHWHALLEVDDALQLARFMQHVDRNLSSEIGRKEIDVVHARSVIEHLFGLKRLLRFESAERCTGRVRPCR